MIIIIIIITPTSSPRAMSDDVRCHPLAGLERLEGAVAASGAKSSSPSTWNKAASLCTSSGFWPEESVEKYSIWYLDETSPSVFGAPHQSPHRGCSMMFISCVGSSARSITVLPDLSGVGKTVSHFFCVGSSVISTRVLCDLSGVKMAIAIFFAFPDLSGVEKDISQAGR